MEKGKAIKFIELTPEGQFSVPDEAMLALQEIGDKKIAPIIIGGPWRSGKSFLANRLLKQMKGFPIGSSIKACTKGIWMWTQPIKLLNDDSYALVMDAEGLYSTERSTNNDIKLFALSILLSSLFIYNSLGHITENSIEDLSVVVNLTKLINVKATENENGNDFNKYFPSFLWVLRDFALDLQKKPPRDYFEDNLRSQPVINEEGKAKNVVRQKITEYFQERDCCTLIRPINDEEKITHLEDLKYEELRPEFIKGCDALIQKILSKLRVKVVNGIPLTASMFMGLAMEYIESLNNQEIPTILSSFERVLQDESRRHSEKILEDLEIKITENFPENLMPFDENNLMESIEKLKFAATNELIKKLHGLGTGSELVESIEIFEERIKILIEKIKDKNKEMSEEYCKDLLQKLEEKMVFPKIQATTDVKPTIMIEYSSEWANFIDDYYNNAKGPAKSKIYYK